MKANLRALPKFRDGLSFLYVEHAVIEREARSVALFTAEGRASVPAAGLGCLLLGPGTRITHAAMVALAECGCAVAWVGEDGLRCYATGGGKSRSSRNLEVQARAHANTAMRMGIVRRLYTMRFAESLPERLTLQQLRGKEGVRVREAYASASREYGVAWVGRRYDRSTWSASDPINRALSAANALLYGVCHAGIHAAGFATGLGFIHVGKQLSFVYDIADLYKTEIVIPAAFQAVATAADGAEREVRRLVRERIASTRLLERVIADLARLFELDTLEAPDEEEAQDGVTRLWSGDGPDSPGGVQYAPDGG